MNFQWCLLQQRMQRLSDLMKRMQAYQCSRVSTDPDQPVPEDVRVISTDEIAAYVKYVFNQIFYPLFIISLFSSIQWYRMILI